MTLQEQRDLLNDLMRESQALRDEAYELFSAGQIKMVKMRKVMAEYRRIANESVSDVEAR